jgi:hypothetical protein
MKLLLGLLLMLTMAACAGGPDASASPDVVPIALPTSQPLGLNQSCPLALYSGTLVAHEEWGIAAIAEGGREQRIVWPYGYFGLEIDGRLALLNESSRVFALVGDRIEAGGGYSAGDEEFVVCGMLRVVAR